MSKPQSTGQRNYKTALTLYYLTLALFVAGSIAAGWRLWGFNYGAFLSEGIGVILLIAVLLAPWVIEKVSLADITLDHELKTYWLSTFSLTLVLTLLFIVFRTRTHFLGDGYTSISLLEVDNPLLKLREMGESYTHLWVKNLIGTGKGAAIASFRVISIGSGLFAIVLCLWAGSKLYGRTAKAIVFALLMLSGGYTLLFFGYVENYSLFMLSVIAVVLAGVLATRHQLPKWLPLPLALFSAMLHAIGVVLVPAALFVALKDTPPGKFFSQSRTRIITMLITLLVIGLVAATWFFQNNQFVRFSILTLTAHEFTVGGYTLFAWEHLSDFVNLLFLLVPALLSVVWLMIKSRTFQSRSSFTYQFLGVTLLLALAAVFIFDPKLGMARDWDLFSFVGVPIMATAALTLLESKRARIKQIIILVLVLNCSILVARLTIVNVEKSAIAQFSSYLDLDIGKSRPGSFVLFKYFQEKGDRAAADSLHQLWKGRYPEMYIMDTVTIDMQHGEFVSAAEKLERIIKLTPTNHDALSNLGSCYTYLHRYDTALVLLNLAVGHNPYNMAAWSNLGAIYYAKGDYRQAEKNWLKAYELDTLRFTAPGNLARLYKKLGERDKCLTYLRKAAGAKDAPPKIYAELAEYFLEENNYARAAALYRFGLERGLDSAVVKEARTKYRAVDSIMSGP